MAAAGRAPRELLSAPVLVLAVLLAGCGSTDTAARGTPSTPTSSTPTSSTPTSSTTPTTAPADSEEPPAQGASWNASGPSSGVDRADWPPTAKGATALLARLPKTLDGESLEPYSDGTGAAYGTLGEVFVQTEEDQDGPDRLTSRQLLMAGFGLGAVCAGKTYRGTAAMPVLREGEQEGALSQAAPGVEAGSTPAWFSCRPVMEDEQWGHAVGWTSGTTAWILYARDEKAARSVVGALHAAAR